MKLFVGITDYDWYRYLATQPQLEEVNFWRPSGATFKALQEGELFLFKLHHPHNYIVGGGFFTRALQLPVRLAWDAFGTANGASTLADVQARIAHYRKEILHPHSNPTIGCIMLAEPFFLPEADWIPVPDDFAKNIVQGKTYDTDSDAGRALYDAVAERLQRQQAVAALPGTRDFINAARTGRPRLVTPRLGQGTFRALVTEAYARRCAITGEKTLPVLEAAHVKPYAKGGEHALRNGLLLRSDLHKLYDQGYVTVDPDDRALIVSPRIREEFENGRHYYALEGQRIATPQPGFTPPSRENLLYHAQHVYLS